MTPDTTVPFITSFSLESLGLWIWLLLVVVFLAHWVVASYHWYVYGSERSISLLSITIYGVAGGSLLCTMGVLLLLT